MWMFHIIYVGAFLLPTASMRCLFLLFVKDSTVVYELIAYIHIFWTFVDNCLVGNHTTYPYVYK